MTKDEHAEWWREEAASRTREADKWKAEVERLREAAKRVLEADMRGERDIDALNALEDAAGFSQQGQRRGTYTDRVCTCLTNQRGPCPVHGGVVLP